jgi:chromosome segregation ATPase
VKGKVEEESAIFRIAGSQNFDLDNFAYRIASGLNDKVKGSEDLKTKILSETLPENIKTSFFDFLKTQQKTLETFDESDLVSFKNTEIPKLIRKHTSLSENPQNDKLKTESFIKDLKVELQSALTKEFDNESVAQVIDSIKTEDDVLRVKGTFKEILKKMLEDKFHLEEKDHISVGEQNLLVKSLSDSLVENEEKIRAIVTGEKASNSLEKPAPLFNDEEAKAQNKKNYEERERVKREERDLKKMAFESQSKEALLLQKLEKLERQLKAKNFIITDTKESLSKLVGKKNQEIFSLQSQVEELRANITSGFSASSASMITDLEKQNSNHLKMIELYKNKVTQLSSTIQDKKSEPHSREEVLKLQKVINQYKNQTEMANKEFARLNDKAAEDAALIANLRQEKTKLDSLFKKIAMEPVTEAPKVDPGLQQELKKLEAHNQTIKKQYLDAQTKVTELAAKLDELNRAPKKDLGSEEGSKAKVNQLEATVKKLTQDILKGTTMVSEMKKETNKLQKEKVFLQNQLDKVTKEMDKNKKTPAKPGAGGKAA